MRRTDRIYRDKADTKRARVHRREDGRWDWDLFKKNALGGGYSVEEGWCGCSTTRTLKDALSWLEDVIGTLTAIDVATVTEGWPEREPPKPTKDAAIKIEVGQIWRRGNRQLRVTWYERHWNERFFEGKMMQVGYIWIDQTGRETGTAIVGRKHEQSAIEHHFREKFRYVDGGAS